MKEAKITPLSTQQYAEISEKIHDEVDKVDHDGMIVTRHAHHPEYGDIILVSSFQGDYIMIHF